MKLALVCPYDLGLDGGVRAQVLGLAGALAAAGEQVVVLGPGSPSPGSPSRAQGGRSEPGSQSEAAGRSELDSRSEVAGRAFRVIPLGSSSKVAANGSLAPLGLAPAVAWRTDRELRRLAPDVVHVHEPFAPLVGLTAAHGRGAPVLATFHRAGADALYRGAGPVLRWLFGRLDDATAVSEAARSTLVEVVGGAAREVEIVPNGVDVERFAAARAAARAAPDAGNGGAPGGAEPTVVFVGRHERRKGLAVLLEAAASCAAPARWLVAGDGPQRRELADRYRDRPNVGFLGRLDDAGLARLLAAADLVVAPSRSGESFGVVLLEAMAAGAPVVASDLPGYREAAGEAACFVPPGDVRALRQALERLLGDPAERRRLAALGRDRVDRFAFPVIAERYRERYRSLAAGRPSRRRSA